MELTGKAKEQFEAHFYSLKDRYFNSVEMFYKASDSMQWGVYVDFFREVLKFNEFLFFHKLYSMMIHEPVFTPQEARTAAIKKANKIVNNR